MAKRNGFARIEIEFPEHLAEEIKKFALAHGLSMSGFIRYAVLEEMSRG